MHATRRFSCQTKGDNDIIDVTREVEEAVATSRVQDGLATVFVSGSTAAVTTIENEPRLLADFKAFMNRLVPRDLDYCHNLTEGDANAHSHLRASLIGPSQSVPVDAGRLVLGTWQQIVLVDFDVRPRTRHLIIEVHGSATWYARGH